MSNAATESATHEARRCFETARPAVYAVGVSRYADTLAAGRGLVGDAARAWSGAFWGAWINLTHADARAKRRAARPAQMAALRPAIERARDVGRLAMVLEESGCLDRCHGLDSDDTCDGAEDAPHTCWRHSRTWEIAARLVQRRDGARRAA